MRLNFFTVDVFTDKRFGGNPLAVVPNAEGLSSEQMQAIATEFNLSETTFILPPKDASNSAHVRIFTPRAELPFAGHPNVGTAFVVAREAEKRGAPIEGGVLLFEELAGVVRMELIAENAETVGARLASPKPFSTGTTFDPAIVAGACGLKPEDIETANHQPIMAGCGTSFVFAELKPRDALAAAAPRLELFEKHMPRDQVTGIHLYLPTDDPEADIHSRMFAPLHGIVEDPATGSANVALIGLLASLQSEPELSLAKTIAQGFDMGRPSIMETLAEKKNGVVTDTFIGGRCVPVMEGVIELD